MHSSSTTCQSQLPLRIACYGFADRTAGSVSSAGFVILDTLLQRGHKIDFFGKSSFFRPRELETHCNFEFVEVKRPRTDSLAGWLRRRRTGVLAYLVSQVAHREFTSNIMDGMRKRNREHRYDVQLLLGDWAWARIDDVPVVSWVQGPPETDARSISRRKSEILRLCGWRTYLPMRVFALYRHLVGLPRFGRSDVIIVGSEWARDRLSSYGVDCSRIKSLPYPTDLLAFRPLQPPPPAGHAPMVLWVGRTVPRKRLDLFLDACSLLIENGSKLNALIVGGFGHFSGYRELIADFEAKHPNRLKHLESVPRDSIVGLIQKADVLVQPSEDENFGSAVAEALACGIPVVLGPTNGTGDYAESAAVRFEHYDAAAVADAISVAIAGRGSLREPARKAAESNFDPLRIAESLEGILKAAAVASIKNQSVHSTPANAPVSQQQLSPIRS